MQKRLSFQRITVLHEPEWTVHDCKKTAQITEIINANKSGSIAHSDIRTGNELGLFDKAPGTAESGHFTPDVSPDSHLAVTLTLNVTELDNDYD